MFKTAKITIKNIYLIYYQGDQHCYSNNKSLQLGYSPKAKILKIQ